MKLNKLLVLFIVFVLIKSLAAFSGHITANTTWSSDVIITGDTWVDEGATLTINAGVTISFPKVDGNSDEIGDIDFIINGRLLTQGTPGNKVVFTSMEADPQPGDWGGIDYLHVLSQNSNLQYTDIEYAYQGIHINGKLFTLNYGTIQQCGNYGIRVENSHSETTSLNNVTIFENTYYGIKVESNGVVNGTGVLVSSNGSHGFWCDGTTDAVFANSRSVSNDGNGIYIVGSSPSFSNTFINSNSNSGIEIEGASSNPSFNNCSIENNDEKGVIFQDDCTGTVEYSNITDNGEFGIFVLDNSLPVINYCNIYDNCSNSVIIYEAIPSNQLYLSNYEGYSSYYTIMMPVNMIDQIHVSGYGDHDGSSDDYTFSVYPSSGSSIYDYTRYNSSSDTSFNLWTNITSTSTSQQLRVYLDIYSIYTYWGRVSEIKYDPLQAQLMCGNSSGTVDAGHNWWGQITGVDDLITQSIPGTVDYATMETELVSAAGASYTNIEPQFTLLTPESMMVNPADVTLTWTDMDVDDDAQISLYYDDGQDATGMLIVDEISEDNTSDSYLWDLSGVPYALYYVYGVIDDGLNTPIVSYADGQVMVGPVSVSAPDDTHGAANSQITIPINVANTYDYFEIISFQFILNFDNLLLTANSVETSGTLADSWTVDSNKDIPGQITVNGFSASMLSSGGTLVELVFDIDSGALDYDDCIINISTFEFNDGGVTVVIDDGLFTVLNEYIISGDVKYYSNTEPVESVSLQLSGTEGDIVDTNTSGAYNFQVHIAGNYELTPSSTLGIPQLVITPYDASLIARYALGLETFDNNQITAGDVNDNLETTVYDAALIAQYSVGLITEFDAGIWKFSPSSYSFELTGGNENVDFDALAVGDPSGNWSATRNEIYDIWDVPATAIRDGETVNVQLTYDDEFYSIYAKISYENYAISYVGINESDDLSDCNVYINDNESEIIVSCFGSETVLSSDVILDFEFTTVSDEVNINDALNIDFVLFDEQSGGNIEFTDFEDENILPMQFELKQNYPNPFNPITIIDFSVPYESEVSIDIYNLKGQKVTNLKNELMPSGIHSVVWNAENTGSGVYFYRITAGDYKETKKMMLIK